ncbi:MAG TPA: HBL/NHE enterotoxin family protein [Thermoanaerobaculia bacterium]|jgi:hypothetical protein
MTARNLTLVSTDNLDLSVNSDAAGNVLADKLDALSIVTAYSHAVVNTVINPVTTPAETWFSKLNDNLNLAKTHSMSWISDVAPKIGSSVPQTIINYNNDFNAATAEMLRIVNGKSSLSLAEKNDLIELIEATLGSLKTQQSAISDVEKQVKQLTKDFNDDHTNLVDGQDGAAKAVELAEAERVGIENKIGELQTELDNARAKVTLSGIGLGLSIFLAVAAFALAVASGGAGALLVAGAIGVVGIGTSATFTGIFSAEISRLISEIAEKQTMLSNKKRQVTALKGLVDSVDKLRGHNEEAKAAMTHISTMWETLGGKLSEVLSKLKNAQGDEVSVTLRRMNINAARTSWDQTAAWAQKVQDLASGTRVQPVIQHDTLRMLA